MNKCTTIFNEKLLRSKLNPKKNDQNKWKATKILLFIGILLVSFKGSSQCPDNYEQNNSCASAANIFQILSTSSYSSGPKTSYISTNSDQDWFLVGISGPGTLTISLTNLPADFDLELYGLNCLNQWMATSDNSGTSSESITQTQSFLQSTQWYIKVYGWNGIFSCSPYTLSIQWTPIPVCTAPTIPSLVFGNSSCPGASASSPTLTWSQASGATAYNLYVSKYPYGPSNNISGYNPKTCVTGTSHTIPSSSIQAGMLYRWTADATSSCGNTNCTSDANSSPRYFYVPPSISPNTTQNICSGSQITFATTSLSVVSPGIISYQWYRDGSAISSATSTTYNATISGSYYVKLTYSGSSYCSSTSIQSVSVTVIVNTLSVAPTSLNVNPSSASAGTQRTLTVSGGFLGTDASWKWYSGNCNGTYLGSTTSASFTVAPNSSTDYFVKADGTCNITTCASGTATVTASCTPPAIPSLVFGNSSCPGTSASSPTLTWNQPSGATAYNLFVSKYPYGSSNNISGYNPKTCVTGTSHTIPSSSIQAGMLYRWTADATSSCGNSNCTSDANSSPRYFYVPPTISPSTSQSICPGEQVSFTTTALSVTSPGVISYQWYRDGSAISSATSTTYNAEVSGSYYVKLTYSGSSYCSSTSIQSASVTVTMNTLSVTPTSLNVNPSSASAGTQRTLTVSGGWLGTGATWKWYSGNCNGTYLGSTTSTSFTVTPNSNTDYFVKADGTCNITTCESGTATVTSVPQYPDLEVINQIVNPSSINAGDMIIASCAINNLSCSASAAATTVNVYLSNDINLTLNQNGDTYLGTISEFPVVPACSNSLQYSKSITIPSISSGSYYIIFWVNPNGAITESNYNNNFASTPITVSTFICNNTIEQPIDDLPQLVFPLEGDMNNYQSAEPRNNIFESLLGDALDGSEDYIVPCGGESKKHVGNDYSAIDHSEMGGRKVYCSFEGIVKRVTDAHVGKLVTIESIYGGKDFCISYQHISLEPRIVEGSYVNTGEFLGEIAWNHLHFQLRKGAYDYSTGIANRAALPQKPNNECPLPDNCHCQFEASNGNKYCDPLFPENFVNPSNLNFISYSEYVPGSLSLNVGGSILRDATIFVKYDSLYNQVGKTDANGIGFLNKLPILNSGDTLMIQANGYYTSKIVIDSLHFISGKLSVAMLDLPNPTALIKLPFASLNYSSIVTNISPISIEVGGENINHFEINSPIDQDSIFEQVTLNENNFSINLDTGYNRILIRAIGTDTAILSASSFYFPGILMDSFAHDQIIIADNNSIGAKLYINDQFFRNIDSSMITFQVLNGSNTLRFIKFGFKDTTLILDEDEPLVISMVPFHYTSELDSALTILPNNGTPEYWNNVTIQNIGTIPDITVSIKECDAVDSLMGTSVQSREIEFRNLSTPLWSKMKAAVSLDQPVNLDNDSIYLLKIYDDSILVKVPVDSTSIWSFDSIVQKLTLNEITFNNGLNNEETYTISKRLSPIAIENTYSLPQNDSLKIPLKYLFLDPDSVPNDLTYQLLDSALIGIEASIQGPNVVLVTNDCYSGITSFTLKATHDWLSVTHEFDVSILGNTSLAVSGGACLNNTPVLSVNGTSSISSIDWKSNGQIVSTTNTSLPATLGFPIAGGNGLGSATNQLRNPQGVFVDASGNSYVADYDNHRVMRWSPNATSGIIVAGGNGSGSAANQLNSPMAVYVDPDGIIYIADAFNNRIQMWLPGASSGITVAGGNGYGSGANQLSNPMDVFVDASGNVFASDQNHRVQKWAPGASSGITVAGGNGSGSAANQLNFPWGIFIDQSGNTFVADRYNNRIQKWAPGSISGITVAGGNGAGSGLNQLNAPDGIFVDESGNIFIADQNNNRIIKWLSGATSGAKVAGSGSYASSATSFKYPSDVYVDGSGNLYIADRENNRVQAWFNHNTVYAPTSEGIYTAVATTQSGCIATSNEIIINSTPTTVQAAIKALGSTTFCAGGDVILQADSTGFVYQWKKSGVGITGATSINYHAFENGIYTCDVANNCGPTTSNAIEVTLSSSPSVSISVTGTSELCPGDVTTITAGGGESYIWSNGETSNSITASAGTSYTVTAYNSCGSSTTSLTIPGFVQNSILWKKPLGGSLSDYISDCTQTSDGGYIITGQTNSNDGDVISSQGNFDVWVIKQDASGNIEWQKTYGGSGVDIGKSVLQCNDGGYVVLASSASTNGDLVGCAGGGWVLKLNSNGIIQWKTCLSAGPGDIIQTHDGGFAVTGSNDQTSLAKLDVNGNIAWEKALPGGTHDGGFSIYQTSDDGFITCGYTYGGVSDYHGGLRDWWVIKTDASGNAIWSKAYGGSDDDFANEVVQTSDGGFLIAGATRSIDGDVGDPKGDWDMWVLQIKSNGKIKWQKNYGGSASDNADVLSLTSDGGFLVGGTSSSNNGDFINNHGGSDVALLIADSKGKIKSSQLYGGSDFDGSQSGIQTDDGNYLLAGYALSSDGDVSGNHGGFDGWEIKVGTIGVCPTPSAGFKTIDITTTSGKIKWNTISCAISYKIKYRIKGTSTWNVVYKNSNVGNLTLESLLPSTIYEWRIYAKCASGPDVYSEPSNIQTFTTLSLKAGEKEIQSKLCTMILHPNPNTGNFELTINSDFEASGFLSIFNALGQSVYSNNIFISEGENTKAIDITNLSTGVYMLQLKTEQVTIEQKVVKQ